MVKKYFGQHFLHDHKVIEKIVDFIAPQKADHLIEIGPGEGALTTELLPKVLSLDVIEIDKTVITRLGNNCRNLGILNIHVEDVLTTDFTKFLEPLRLVGNLPYNISTPLLFKVIKNINLIQDMHFMLQKEVAERIVAPPGSKTYGRLSVMLQYYCETKMLLAVGPGAFSPPPKVDSAFIRLLPRKHHKVKAYNENLFAEIVRAAFSKRRKILLNAVKHYITSSQLKDIGIDPNLRPEQLSVDDFVLISNEVEKII